MRKNMKTKKIILSVALLSMFILLSSSINATAIITKEMTEKKITFLEKHKDDIEYFLRNVNVDEIQSLHDFYMLVWEFISILIGHNVVSLAIARLCTCWVIFPTVVLNNLININITGHGGFLKYINEGLEYFNISNIFYSMGIFSFIIIPFIYTFIFCLAIFGCIKDGFNIQGGILDRIKNELNYIYNPDSKLLIENNYFYRTGLFGILIKPFIKNI